MKVAIATKDQTPETSLYAKFSRCTAFFIFDTKTGQYTIIENKAAHIMLGAGSSAAKLIHENGATAIIAGYYSPYAATALRNLGIKMYLSAEEKIWTVYDKFKNNLLIEAKTVAIAGKHA
jgi:predicted Fe-Mo cluster-binding NifX family protein